MDDVGSLYNFNFKCLFGVWIIINGFQRCVFIFAIKYSHFSIILTLNQGTIFLIKYSCSCAFSKWMKQWKIPVSVCMPSHESFGYHIRQNKGNSNS